MKRKLALLLSMIALFLCLYFLSFSAEKEGILKGNKIENFLYVYKLNEREEELSGYSIKDKEIYYLLTAAENGKSTFDRADACLDGLCDCLSDIKIKGMIYAGGVWKKGEINSTRYIQQAYDMGAAV